jgi:adenosylhomocysteine nucleosidase
MRFLVCRGLPIRLVVGVWLAATVARAEAPPSCLTECTLRIGLVSAFGAEADMLLAQTDAKQTYTINGNRFTTGVLRANRVVIVLSGVSMINATMTTQLLLDHFRIERLIMSGIAGGVNPAHQVGDIIAPDRWTMPMEVYWHHDASVPAPCGRAGDVSCLGLKLASRNGQVLPSFHLQTPQGAIPTGLFMREQFVMTTATSPTGEFRLDYPVDATMLDVARSLAPRLARCGPRAIKEPGAAPDPTLCVHAQPRLIVGGRGVSSPAFLAHPQYRQYLYEQLQAETVEMETAALAHVAYANGIPYLAFRSLSDLAGAQEFNADVGALFASGLAETNASAVTLAFLEAWQKRQQGQH